jgi:outer membrane receptor protein involved in Fe transport
MGGESADNFRHDADKRFNATPSLMWRLSNASQLDFRYMFDRNRVSGDAGIPLVPLTGGFVPSPERTAIGDPLSRAVQGDGTDVIPKVARDVRYNTPQDFGLAVDHNVRLSVSQMFARGVAFRDTVGYRDFDDEYWTTESLDVTPPSRVNRGFLYFEHHRQTWMNQAEVSGILRLGFDHNLLAGWDYQDHGNRTDRRGTANYNTTPVDLYNPVETHVPVNVHTFPLTRYDYLAQTTNGVFFQDTMTVVPTLKVVIGSRYDRVRRANHNNPIANGIETEVAPTRARSEKATYRVGVVYQPVKIVDLYVQNSTAFRPNFSIQADGTPLKPEYGELYEAGQRLRLFQQRLEWSASVFQIEKRNVARSIGGGNFDQIGKLRSRGFETELHGRPDIKPESRPRIRLHESGVRRLLHQRGRQPVRQDSSPRPTSYGELLERVRLAERVLSHGRRTGRVASVHQRHGHRRLQRLRAAVCRRDLHAGSHPVRVEPHQPD